MFYSVVTCVHVSFAVCVCVCLYEYILYAYLCAARQGEREIWLLDAGDEGAGWDCWQRDQDVLDCSASMRECVCLKDTGRESFSESTDTQPVFLQNSDLWMFKTRFILLTCESVEAVFWFQIRCFIICQLLIVVHCNFCMVAFYFAR